MFKKISEYNQKLSKDSRRVNIPLIKNTTSELDVDDSSNMDIQIYGNNQTKFIVAIPKGTSKRAVNKYIKENGPEILAEIERGQEKESVNKHIKDMKSKRIKCDLPAELEQNHNVPDEAIDEMMDQFNKASVKHNEKKTGIDSKDAPIITKAFAVIAHQNPSIIFPAVKADNFDLIIAILKDEMSCLTGDLLLQVQAIIDSSEGYGE